MAKTSAFLMALATIVAGTLAEYTGNHGGGHCCRFTLSSHGSFDCPAGELEDGQIRLNGTYDTSTFCIDSEGGITNSRGFGCIVTEEPTTQIQCDEGKQPTRGFSIGANNTLQYQGNSSFYACPATDTEYNIYVSPNFGQLKCFPVTLQSDGCGAASCPPPSTLWQTEWVTNRVNHTVTYTMTEFESCTSAPAIPTPETPAPPTTPVTPAPPPPTPEPPKTCDKAKCHRPPFGNSTVKPCQKPGCHHSSDGWETKNSTSTVQLPTSPADTALPLPPMETNTTEEPATQTSTDVLPTDTETKTEEMPTFRTQVEPPLVPTETPVETPIETPTDAEATLEGARAGVPFLPPLPTPGTGDLGVRRGAAKVPHRRWWPRKN